MNPTLEALISQFNDKHNPSTTQQFLALVEEVGELSEARNRSAGQDAVVAPGAGATSRVAASRKPQEVDALGSDTSSRTANREGSQKVAEELADIVFVAYTLADLHEIDLTREVTDVATENLHKGELEVTGSLGSHDPRELLEDDEQAEDIREWNVAGEDIEHAKGSSGGEKTFVDGDDQTEDRVVDIDEIPGGWMFQLWAEGEDPINTSPTYDGVFETKGLTIEAVNDAVVGEVHRNE